VRWLAETFERRTGVRVSVASSGDTLHVPPAVQLVAYRTAQEALTNVGKYAQARQVRIDLSDHEGVLTLEVQDDGQGMAPEALKKPRSFGLKGLQERARRVGGWMDVSSRPGQGTLVVVSVPLN
jgi:signal transduction histidine kinase